MSELMMGMQNAQGTSANTTAEAAQSSEEPAKRPDTANKRGKANRGRGGKFENDNRTTEEPTQSKLKTPRADDEQNQQ